MKIEIIENMKICISQECNQRKTKRARPIQQSAFHVKIRKQKLCCFKTKASFYHEYIHINYVQMSYKHANIYESNYVGWKFVVSLFVRAKPLINVIIKALTDYKA